MPRVKLERERLAKPPLRRPQPEASSNDLLSV
jgi:hypothetical protein